MKCLLLAALVFVAITAGCSYSGSSTPDYTYAKKDPTFDLAPDSYGTNNVLKRAGALGEHPLCLLKTPSGTYFSSASGTISFAWRLGDALRMDALPTNKLVYDIRDSKQPPTIQFQWDLDAMDRLDEESDDHMVADAVSMANVRQACIHISQAQLDAEPALPIK